MSSRFFNRADGSQWGVLAFFVGAIAIVLVAFYQYLLPAIGAAGSLNEDGRKELAAVSRLVLAVVLVILVAGMLLTIRPWRFFIHRSASSRTRYVDAWEEAGKRMQAPRDEESGG